MKLKLLSSAILVAMLSGCGNSSKVEEVVQEVEQKVEEATSDNHDHDIEFPLGRLAFSYEDESQVSIFDLTDKKVLDTLTLTNNVDYLTSSNDGRYVIARQRNDHLVQFIDGGVFLEPHDDHHHLEQEAPAAVSFELAGTKPTHIVMGEESSLVFFDGDKDSGASASFSIISGDSIKDGKKLADHGFTTYMHGTGEIRGEYVLSTLRSEPTSESSLPDTVALFHLHDDHFHLDKEFEDACPSLHGSVQTHDFVAFGCGNGVLSIKNEGDTFTSSHIANPTDFVEGQRIGKFIGGEHSDTVIGVSKQGLYTVNLEDGAIAPFAWQAEGITSYLAYGTDASAEHALILDEAGYLNVYHAEHGYESEARFKVIEELEEDVTVKLIANKAHDFVYLAYGDHLYAIDLDNQKSEEIYHFEKPLKGITWVGAFDSEHEEHDH